MKKKKEKKRKKKKETTGFEWRQTVGDYTWIQEYFIRIRCFILFLKSRVIFVGPHA